MLVAVTLFGFFHVLRDGHAYGCGVGKYGCGADRMNAAPAG
jgi:hypothetical protein